MINTSGILLAAGFSNRFGSAKALASFQGATVIESLQNEMVNSRLEEIVIVLGAHAEGIKPLLLNHKKIKVVYNKDYNLGQTSSFKAALQEIEPGARAILLIPVDYPLITAKTIDLLIDAFNQKTPLILVPTFNNKKGHPPVFAAALKDEFLALDNGLGINTVIHRHEKDTVLMPLSDRGIIKTFNSKEELEALKVQELI